MGMPGSSEILQELTSHVFGDLLTEGFLVIIADDLFIGANTIEEMLLRWTLVLQRLKENNLTLSPTKTIIYPKTITILGWIWSSGTLSPSKHKIAALSATQPPKSCSSMQSYIGEFKAVSRCVPQYASLLSGLEDSIKGLQGTKSINWTTELSLCFQQLQSALPSPVTLTIPKPSDQLILTVVPVKFHNVYDYTIVRHPWQVSENHKPRVNPSHVWEIGKSVRYLTKHKIEL